ncbi:hypothetical protein COOONC_04506 [Cooperia oncophora]
MRSRDMLVSMYQMAPKGRAKRGWLFGQWVPDGGWCRWLALDMRGPQSHGYAPAPPPSNGYGPVVNAEPEPQCCTCQQVRAMRHLPTWTTWTTGNAGAKGPQGPRGTPGLSGVDGRRGEPGMVGPAATGATEPGYTRTKTEKKWSRKNGHGHS